MDVRNRFSNDIIIPRLFGVFAYRITDRFELSQGEFAYSLSFILFFIAHGLHEVHFNALNSPLKIFFISTVESSMMALSISLCCFELYKKTEHLNSIYYLFLKTDLLFQRLEVKTYVRQLSRKKLLKLLYLWPILVIIGFDIERFVREGNLNLNYIHPYLSKFVHIWCNVEIFGIAIAFSVFTDTLGDYMSTLNVAVRSEGNWSKRSILVISETYDSLWDAFRKINSVFASTLLIMVLNCFVKCTDNFYKIIKGDEEVYWCVYFAVWMAVVIMQLLLLVRSVNYPLKEANLYEWLMYKRMKNEPPSSFGSSQTKLTLHLIRRKKATFDLCGFSTLDNGLLGKISAATLTYSIVLSQLNSYPLLPVGLTSQGSSCPQ